jgi:AbrB family looped-hinge helix DNA binding protein
MHATIQGRGQIVIPAEARRRAKIVSGDVVEVLPEADGRIVLVRLERTEDPKPSKTKITYRKGSHAVASTGRAISSEQVRKLLKEL